MLQALLIGAVSGAVAGSIAPLVMWLLAPKLGEWRTRHGR